MKSMAYYHDNILTAHALAYMKTVKEDVLQVMEPQATEDNTLPQHHTNSETSDNTQVEILKLLQNIKGALKDLKSNSNNYNT